MTLTDLCEVLRNWFDVDRHIGDFTIENGTLDLDYLAEGQYFRIVGSIFNDGVHLNNDKLSLKDESFHGAIWSMAVPQNVVDLVTKITEWETDNADALKGAYASESFGGYSYSLGTSGGEGLSWQSHFKKELERWQKI